MKRLFISLFLSMSILMSLTQCQKQIPQIIIETEMGDIIIELYRENAPITVDNFLQYIAEERLNESAFYRVVRNDNQNNHHHKIQVIQGGLFEDEHPLMRAPIAHEDTKSTGILHKRGSISMARYEPGTATSEFFICIDDEPELDRGGSRNKDKVGYAAFGRVVSGIDIVDKIHQGPAKGQYLEPRILIKRIKKAAFWKTYI